MRCTQEHDAVDDVGHAFHVGMLEALVADAVAVVPRGPPPLVAQS
jgi:hypothetical protein